MTFCFDIVVFFVLGYDEEKGDDEGKKLGGADGKPNCLLAEQCGKCEDAHNLEKQSSRKGDNCTDYAVIQGGEESGSKNIIAAYHI